MIYLALAILFLHILLFAVSVNVQISYSSDNNTVNVRLAFYVLPIFPPVPFFVKTASLDELLRTVKSRKNAREQNNCNCKSVKKKDGKPDALKLRFVKNVLLRVRAKNLVLDGTVDVGDAAASAVICSLANVAYAQLCAYFNNAAASGLKPEYDGAGANIRLGGIFCIELADIIIALCESVCGAQRRVYERNSAD